MVDALGPAVTAYQAVIDTGGDLAGGDPRGGRRRRAGPAGRPSACRPARAGRAISARGPIGHEDPGAASTVLILRALATATARRIAGDDRRDSEPVGRLGGGPGHRGRGVVAGRPAGPGRRRPRSTRTRSTRAFRAVAADLERLGGPGPGPGPARGGGHRRGRRAHRRRSRISSTPPGAAAAADDPLRAIHDAVEGYAGDARVAARRDAARARRRRPPGRAAGDRADRPRRHRGQHQPVDPPVRAGRRRARPGRPARPSRRRPGRRGRRARRRQLPRRDRRALGRPAAGHRRRPGGARPARQHPAAGRRRRRAGGGGPARRRGRPRRRGRRARRAAPRRRSPPSGDGRTSPPTGSRSRCCATSPPTSRSGPAGTAARTGVGLLRTELPFLHADRWPTEADHRRALRPILAEAAGWPVTVRLLDFANDKIPPFLGGGRAGLPALLDHPAALAAQLRAVVDLGRDVQLRIMVPMVTAAAELRTVRPRSTLSPPSWAHRRRRSARWSRRWRRSRRSASCAGSRTSCPSAPTT